MLRTAATFGLSAFAASSLFAQSQISAQPIPGAVRNAGTYHVDTGTWTRGGQQLAGIGPDTIYDNTAESGYFTTAGMADATGDWSWIDEGRLPGTDSDVPGAQYFPGAVVGGIAFSYCTDSATPIGITFQLYDGYEPCDLIRTAPMSPFSLAGTIAAPALPVSPMGGTSCWTVTLDLGGVGGFVFEPDGGTTFPGYDGDLNLDSFGIEWIFTGAAGTETGPILAGDPQWTASVAGALLHGGTGTYYSFTSSCANTGLDTQDFVAADQLTTGLPGPDCYFFGGYQNPVNGCGGPAQTPFASFSSTIFGDAAICLAACTSNFCEPAGVNSSGNAALLSVSSATGGAGVRLEASGGPQIANSGFGYFIVSSGIMNALTVGDGTLCLQNPQGRYSPSGPAALNSLGKFNQAGEFENLVGTSTTGFGFDLPTQLPSPPGGSIQAGSTWYFQLWYRDLNPGPSVNFSNGVFVDF